MPVSQCTSSCTRVVPCKSPSPFQSDPITMLFEPTKPPPGADVGITTAPTFFPMVDKGIDAAPGEMFEAMRFASGLFWRVAHPSTPPKRAQLNFRVPHHFGT